MVAVCMAAQDDVREQYRFDRFVLEPVRRSLTKAGKPVPLSSRAFDLLRLLVEERHRVVGKDELRARVWHGMTVDDNNLAVQISVLRRALGEKAGGAHFILTVPGQGYQFVAPVDEPASLRPDVARDDPAGMPRPADRIAAAPPDLPPMAVPARHGRLAWLAAGAVLFVALAAWLGLPPLLSALRPPPAPRLSIVVLPFRNLSGEAEQDYLADAISDDLTTDLSHIPQSVVIARTSADTYRGRAVAADAIGRALHVRYLLEGSLRAEGARLHINAQLIDASSGSHLWARAFDVPRDKLGVAREDIVRNIASALDLTLVEVESARSLRERPRNQDAVDFYLRARSVLARGNTLGALSEAQALLEQAVAAEPRFGDALAALGSVLVRKVSEFDDPEDARDFARAQAVITQAVDVAPRNGAAITAKGYLERVEGHCDEARASFDLALSLDATDLLARNGRMACARAQGRMDDMIAELHELMRIDPASPANARREHMIGFGLLMLGRPREAMAWFDRAGAALGAASLGEPTLGWQEWRQIYRIAARELVGDRAGAASEYAAYARLRPHRTVWRLAGYNTRALAALPGCNAYLAALREAGMPEFADETEDFGVPPPSAPRDSGDFDPTPLSVPGTTRIDTARFAALLATTPKPLVLDVGRGAAVPAGALWVGAQGRDDTETLLARVLPEHAPDHGPSQGRPIVVMGDGTTGWASANAALHLVAMGFRSVLWYRGGDEAWASAGHAGEDRRPP